jgi:ech hydrogenase subunit D
MKAQKELVAIEEIKAKIAAFYDPKIWHFVCINGLFEENLLEIQWSFTKIGAKDEWKVFYAKAEENAILPSLSDILPTAKMYEGELRDLLDANFEGSVKGMFIEVDGEIAPLKGKR